MTVSAALGWTGAVLLIPAIIAWCFAGMADNNPRLRLVCAVIAVLFTIAILAFWIAALWQAVSE